MDGEGALDDDDDVVFSLSDSQLVQGVEAWEQPQHGPFSPTILDAFDTPLTSPGPCNSPLPSWRAPYSPDPPLQDTGGEPQEQSFDWGWDDELEKFWGAWNDEDVVHQSLELPEVGDEKAMGEEEEEKDEVVEGKEDEDLEEDDTAWMEELRQVEQFWEGMELDDDLRSLSQSPVRVLPDDPYRHLFDELLTSQTGGGKKKEDPPKDAPKDTFAIDTVLTKNCPKFNAQQKVFQAQIQLQPRKDIQQAVEAAESMIRQLIEHVTREMNSNSNDQIRLVIQGQDLAYPIEFPFMEVSELTPLRLLRHLQAVQQSKREFLLQGTMQVVVYHVINVSGRGVCKSKRFEKRKHDEPLPWLKTLASRNVAVVCGSVHEALAQYLQWRERGLPYHRHFQAKALTARRLQVEAQSETDDKAEPLVTMLTRLNEYLVREWKARVVVLDWSHHDQPFFVGPPDETVDDVCFLYKIHHGFHLLLHPDKIQHVERHNKLCRQCFFFFTRMLDAPPCMRARTKPRCPKCRDDGPTARSVVTL